MLCRAQGLRGQFVHLNSLFDGVVGESLKIVGLRFLTRSYSKRIIRKKKKKKIRKAVFLIMVIWNLDFEGFIRFRRSQRTKYENASFNCFLYGTFFPKCFLGGFFCCLIMKWMECFQTNSRQIFGKHNKPKRSMVQPIYRLENICGIVVMLFFKFLTNYNVQAKLLLQILNTSKLSVTPTGNARSVMPTCMEPSYQHVSVPFLPFLS